MYWLVWPLPLLVCCPPSLKEKTDTDDIWQFIEDNPLANESEVDLFLLASSHVWDLPEALVKQNLFGVRRYQPQICPPHLEQHCPVLDWIIWFFWVCLSLRGTNSFRSYVIKRMRHGGRWGCRFLRQWTRCIDFSVLWLFFSFWFSNFKFPQRVIYEGLRSSLVTRLDLSKEQNLADSWCDWYLFI